MATDSKPQNSNNGGNKDRKRKRFLPHSKAVKKGGYPLKPGVQGFFMTCDGGRERQAAQEAISVLDTFYEQLVDDDDTGFKQTVVPVKPLNKKITFADSDSSSDDEESCQPKEEDPNHENTKDEVEDASVQKQHIETEAKEEDTNHEDQTSDPETLLKKQRLETEAKEEDTNRDDQTNDEETLLKKQRLETAPTKCENIDNVKPETKSIDKQIEEELKELKDRTKRRFVSLDSGCNGVVFVQMIKRDGNPSPSEIVKHMMTSAAATRKHMSRFILRVLPAELTCYASEEEISKAIKPLMDQYFPADAQTPLKFAVLFDARANTGIDRMAIINAVAKSVPAPHKVDLNNPDKSITVQIARTVCSIGVVEKYKELAKYNLRQLTSPKE
ncbi:hypothetical protein ACHQM5_019089 [Ranunculus cassubicifolius]